jgi:hypothetical protein
MFDGFRRTAGLIISLIPALMNLAGFETAPGFTEDASQLVEGILGIVGVGLTLYGIIKAKGPMWFQKKKV